MSFNRSVAVLTFGQVYYIAEEASEQLVNNDEYNDRLPFYFEIDLASIQQVSISLHKVEHWLHTASSEFKHLEHSQG